MPNLYSEDTIQEVCEKNDIVDVISRYVTLKRAGSNHKGLCPFHGEKTPSFVVSSSKQLFHCFGCGEGGNVISFIMKQENLSFIEALQFLADKSGIILKEEASDFESKEIQEKNLLFDINRDAARYFFSNLSSYKKPQDYILERGIDSNTAKSFGLGYSTSNWADLLTFLKGKGYKESDIEKTGLIIKNKEKTNYYDRFRDRLMFPIINTRGKVIGFGGRVLDNSHPKYLNSPESVVFSKGNNLYGLNIAKKYIKDNGIILVEGYMDVIALYRRGIKNAIASLGTALTSNQAKIIKRYSQEVYICYDSDDAGMKATDKALDVLKAEGLEPKVILLTDGKDPDDFISEYGKDAFQKQLNKALVYIDYKIFTLRKKYDINNIQQKIFFTREVASLLKRIKSPIELDAYIKKISLETQIDISAIKNEMYDNQKSYNREAKPKDKYINENIRNNNKGKISPVKVEIEPGHQIAEKNLINLIINDKKHYTKVKDFFTPKDFLNPTYRRIAEIVYEKYENKDELSHEEILHELQAENLDINIQDFHINLQLDDKEKDKAVDDFINKLNHYKLRIKKDNIRTELSNIDAKKDKTEGDEEKYRRLCIELVKIEKELKIHQ